jgi:hypothetical protein
MTVPLPEIKVLREDYCGQEMTDYAIDFVQWRRPDLIEKLMDVEHWRQQDYSEAAWDILEYLTEEKVDIPTTLVGRLDLIAEFTRRGRMAWGLPEVPPSGHAITSEPGQPPPALEITEHTTKFNHVSQEMADHVLHIAYETRPDIWFATAEEQRYEICLDATCQFQTLLREILDAEYPGKSSMWPSMYMYDEGVQRMYRMCGIV